MGLDYLNLNEIVRQSMLAELERGDIYLSPRLNESGKQKWEGLFKDAIQYHTDVWLERELIRRNCFLDTEYLKSSMGRTIKRAINKAQSARILSEREFNRYYLRGLCALAIEQGRSHLILYQAKSSAVPSEVLRKKVGTPIEVKALLSIMRARSVSLELVLSLEGVAHYTLSARMASAWELAPILDANKNPTSLG